MTSNFYTIKVNQTVKNFIIEFEEAIKIKKIFTAIKFDKKNRVIGVLTRGDLRRLVFRGNKLNEKIDKFLNFDPILIKSSELDNDLFSTLIKKSKGKIFDDIILVDVNNKFIQIIKYDEIKNNFKYKNTCIIGMGHIGLPLSVYILKKFKNVTGYDINKKKINRIKKIKLDFYEKNLEKLLTNHIKNKRLSLVNNFKSINSEVYIVCIGSIIKNNKVINKNLKDLAKNLSKKLKKDDLIILRGTVSVGASRGIFLNTILKHSNLKNGRDFYFSFMPERIIEGDALDELERVPQLVSGSTHKCLQVAYDYSKEIFQNVIKLKSLEEGEIIKLASNSFRSLNFAFSNEVSRISNLYGLSGSELIKKANFGYERNNISKPSLGVGGFCLPKDPLLFSYNSKKLSNYKLGKISHDINQDITQFYLSKFLKILKKIHKPKILMMGISFKGYPETLDLRNSTSIEMIKVFLKNKYVCHAYDPLGYIIKKKIKIKKLKILNENLNISNYDFIIIVNDHPKFFEIIENKLKENKSKKNKYIFDTWNNINSSFVENLGWKYLNI